MRDLANYTAQTFPERLDDPLWQEGFSKEIVKDIRDSLRNITHLDYFTLTFRRIPTLQRKFQQLQQFYSGGQTQQLQNAMQADRMWLPFMIFSGIMNALFFMSMMSLMGAALTPQEGAFAGDQGAGATDGGGAMDDGGGAGDFGGDIGGDVSF